MSFPMTTRSPGEAEAPVPVMAGEADGWRAARFTDRAFRSRRRECVMERTCLLPLGRRPRQIHLGQGRRPESSLSAPACPKSRAPHPCSKGCRNRERSEEHTSELQSLMRISYAVFCLKKKKKLMT